MSIQSGLFESGNIEKDLVVYLKEKKIKGVLRKPLILKDFIYKLD